MGHGTSGERKHQAEGRTAKAKVLRHDGARAWVTGRENQRGGVSEDCGEMGGNVVEAGRGQVTWPGPGMAG